MDGIAPKSRTFNISFNLHYINLWQILQIKISNHKSIQSRNPFQMDGIIEIVHSTKNNNGIYDYIFALTFWKLLLENIPALTFWKLLPENTHLPESSWRKQGESLVEKSSIARREGRVWWKVNGTRIYPQICWDVSNSWEKVVPAKDSCFINMQSSW